MSDEIIIKTDDVGIYVYIILYIYTEMHLLCLYIDILCNSDICIVHERGKVCSLYNSHLHLQTNMTRIT